MQHPVLKSWLALQCRSLAGTRAALVHVYPVHRPPAMAVAAGDASAAEPDLGAPLWFALLGQDPQSNVELNDILNVAMSTRSVVVATPEDADGELVIRIAQPIELAQGMSGAIAVELLREDVGQQDRALRLLQWGSAWLDLLLAHSEAPHTALAPHQMAWQQEIPELLHAVSAAQSFQRALMTTSSYLAHRLGFEYVAIALREGTRFKVQALSDSAVLTAHSELAERFSEDVDAIIAGFDNEPTDVEPDGKTAPSHAVRLDNGVIGALLRSDDAIFGVLVAEPRADEPTSRALVDALETSARVLGPALAIKQRAHLSLLAASRLKLRSKKQDLTSRHGVLRLGLITLGSLMALLLLMQDISHRVSGQARVEGAIQRAVIAPYDGYIVRAHVRAGEGVDKGTLLAELDDQPLQLRLRELQGNKTETSKEYRQALAGFDKPRAKILEAQLEQSTARIDQINQQLSRTELRAPFAGIIVSGDLSRSLGKPVYRGEVLFEVAPLDGYRVAVTVKDQDIAELDPGQTGSLVLAALSSHALDIKVTSIAQLPDDEQHPGEFRVEATLTGDTVALRPGMRGIAKINAGERPRWWVWTNSMSNWLRYKFWQWLP